MVRRKELAPTPEEAPFPKPEYCPQGKIIGIAGQKFNGKSTLCNVLLKMLNDYSDHNQLNTSIRGGVGAWRRSKLSAPIKHVTAALMGCTMEFIEAHKDGPPLPGWEKNLRWVLERIGSVITEACPDHWISRAVVGLSHNAISDDIRCLVELETIKSIGGTNVLIWRPGFENFSRRQNRLETELIPLIKQHIKVYKKAGHDGALGVSPLIDYFIVNDGSPAVLKKRALDIVVKGVFGKLLKRDFSHYAAP